MQTFLTSIDFEIAAKQLDNQRLGKQRVETIQILKSLTNPDYGWRNHPAVNMWRGYELLLCDYGYAVCSEWIKRGYNDTCYDKIEKIHINLEWSGDIRIAYNPSWLTEEFCSNHRSILLGKAWEKFLDTRKERDKKILEWYLELDWKEQPAEKVMRNGRLVWPYIWPERV